MRWNMFPYSQVRPRAGRTKINKIIVKFLKYFFVLTLPDGHRYRSQGSCFHLGYFKQDSVAPNFDHQSLLSLVFWVLGVTASCAPSAPRQLLGRHGVSLAWYPGPDSGVGAWRREVKSWRTPVPPLPHVVISSGREEPLRGGSKLIHGRGRWHWCRGRYPPSVQTQTCFPRPSSRSQPKIWYPIKLVRFLAGKNKKTIILGFAAFTLCWAIRINSTALLLIII